MRIGVLGSYQQVPTSAQSDAMVPITSPGGITYGLSKSGDTLICPKDYPYDAVIKDCKGYSGSAVDVATQSLQAQMDACTSGYGQWDMANSVCIPRDTANSGTIIPGVPDWAVYGVGGILGLMLVMNLMRGGR